MVPMAFCVTADAGVLPARCWILPVSWSYTNACCGASVGGLSWADRPAHSTALSLFVLFSELCRSVSSLFNGRTPGHSRAQRSQHDKQHCCHHLL